MIGRGWRTSKRSLPTGFQNRLIEYVAIALTNILSSIWAAPRCTTTLQAWV
ncbi:MAG: hypothetical protein ICV63_06815 [Coleofasciculus sp. Co-bin14]|nr:hypothetical protein [Coleofasciculus sp. Co-bin14]